MSELKQFLIQCNYKYQELTANDVEMALESFGLELSVQSYNYPNGLDKELISLEGLISINQIPIQIYLSDSHPYTAPICYVRPMIDEFIKSSVNVDTDGLINLPLEWQPESSDLILLINLISMIFNEDVPIIKMNKTQNRSGVSVISENENEITRQIIPQKKPK